MTPTERRPLETAAEFKDSTEGRVLLALVTQDFPGSAELRDQVGVAKVERLQGDRAHALRFTFGRQVRKADVRYRVPVECETMDEGPRRIHCLLHVVDGRLHLLEFFRENGDPIDVVPSPGEMRFIVM